MNLIIVSHPKDHARSLSGALANELANRLSGPTTVLRIYDSKDGYFQYAFRQDWIDLLKIVENIILPVPMWNFTIPAALKDFIDKVTKQGEIWDIDREGNFIGLLKDRPVYIIMTAGGEYPEGSALDFVVPYLRAVFSFMGIQNIRDFRVGNVTDSQKLIADKKYFNTKVSAMLKVFHIK